MKHLFQRLRMPVAAAWYRGTQRQCPVCQASLRLFLPFGAVRRFNARCPVCGALERHRMVWLFFQQQGDLFSGEMKRVLHFAPEPQIRAQLAAQPHLDYQTVDLEPGRADHAMDITDLQFADNSFDIIYCSHVLEHVVDDRKAMRELNRVLKPGGWAVLQVPIKGDKTHEDPTVASPAERLRLFGQADHVRQYGRDYLTRLEESGFDVDVIAFVETLPAADRERYGLVTGDDIYFCRIPSGTAGQEAGHRA